MAVQVEEREEAIEIDINDASLVAGEELEQDLKEDWQAKAAPPPAKRYALKIFIEDDKVEVNVKKGFSKTDPNGKYYKKNVTCKIQDPTGKWQDSIVFDSFGSSIPRGKKVSQMAGMLAMLRVKVQPKMSELDLTKLFIKALKKLDGPVMIADCDWSVWDRNSGKGEYGSALLVGMKNFPKKADGTHEHIINNKKGEEFVAKLKIVKWIGQPTQSGKEEAAQGKVVSQPAKQAPKVTPKPEVVEEVAMDDDGEVIIDV